MRFAAETIRDFRDFRHGMARCRLLEDSPAHTGSGAATKDDTGAPLGHFCAGNPVFCQLYTID
jgi:hypothetical protein